MPIVLSYKLHLHIHHKINIGTIHTWQSTSHWPRDIPYSCEDSTRASSSGAHDTNVKVATMTMFSFGLEALMYLNKETRKIATIGVLILCPSNTASKLNVQNR